MPAYQLEQFLPDIDPSCWIAPCATVIGNVVVGSGSSIWFGSVVRGDNEPIVIGERINIQDGCILQSCPGSPLRIGNDTTVGHRGGSQPQASPQHPSPPNVQFAVPLGGHPLPPQIMAAVIAQQIWIPIPAFAKAIKRTWAGRGSWNPFV